MDWDTVATIISTFVTTVLTAAVTLLAVHLTNRENRNQKDQQLKHEKDISRQEAYREEIESTYDAAYRWFDEIEEIFKKYKDHLKMSLSPEQAHEAICLCPQDQSVYYLRLKMMIDFYFPVLDSDFDRVNEIILKANEWIRIYTYKPARTIDDDNDILGRWTALLSEYKKAKSVFIKAVVREARAI